MTEHSSQDILKNTGYQDIFVNADLVVFYKDKPIIYIEVEKTNDIVKSLSNLNKHYAESYYKALFVVEEKLSEATRIRNGHVNSFGIHVYKLAVGFSDNFKADITKIIKEHISNK